MPKPPEFCLRKGVPGPLPTEGDIIMAAAPSPAADAAAEEEEESAAEEVLMESPAG
jgi:hypothetical protein